MEDYKLLNIQRLCDLLQINTMEKFKNFMKSSAGLPVNKRCDTKNDLEEIP